MAKRSKPEKFIPCVPMSLPPGQLVAAAARAVEINPANRPSTERITELLVERLPQFLTALMVVGDGEALTPQPDFQALLTTKYWGAKEQEFAVAFVDNTPADVRDRILSHANAWSQYCGKRFRWTQQASSADCRISRGSGGYWSYLGTDNRMIPKNQQTMNLQGFTMQTSEVEYRRVVRHEFGHFLSLPHEHMLMDVVKRIDPDKAVAYFRRTQGWSAEMVRQQVLTPLEEGSLMGRMPGDEDSIMCYQLPGSITKDGRPIRGGNDINAADQQFIAKVYPKADGPPPPPPPGKKRLVIEGAYTFREEAVPAATKKPRRKLVA